MNQIKFFSTVFLISIITTILGILLKGVQAQTPYPFPQRQETINSELLGFLRGQEVLKFSPDTFSVCYTFGSSFSCFLR